MNPGKPESLDIVQQAPGALAPAPENKAPIAGAKPAVELLKYGERGVALSSMEELFRLAKAILLSGLAPTSFKTQESILVAIQLGAEIGLPPMSALSSIAVINGRPCLFGDAIPGIVSASGLLESYKDEQIGTIGDDNFGYRVSVVRKGRTDPIVRTFMVANAKKAGLWGKSGPWSSYPERMLLMRARGFAFRDGFADVLRGLQSVEEVRDTPREEKNITPGLDAIDGGAK